MNIEPKPLIPHAVDIQLADTTILRHLPQLRRLQGTTAYNVIMNLCYFAQSHIECSWDPQNRPKALLFFQAAQFRVSELMRSSTCQDTTEALRIVRSRIAAMELLVKTVDTANSANNQTWKQALDPLVQMFKSVRKLCLEDDTSSVLSECSTCDEYFADETSSEENPVNENAIMESLQPTLTFSQSTHSKLSVETCRLLSVEPNYDSEDDMMNEQSSLSACSFVDDQSIFTSPRQTPCKQELNTPIGEVFEETEVNDEDTSSEYMPVENASRASTDDEEGSDKETLLFETTGRRHSASSSCKTSVNDAESPSQETTHLSITKYSSQTLRFLETMFYEVYSCRSKLSKQERYLIQRQTGLPPRSITYWFANHKRRYQRELLKYRRSGAKSYAEYLDKAYSKEQPGQESSIKGKGHSKARQDRATHKK